jgi:hypothetical protein
MNRLLLTSAVVAFAVLNGTGRACAQNPFYPNASSYPGYYNYSRFSNPLTGPALSPYLNLRRGIGTPALNYFLGTLPELDRRANAMQTFYRLRNVERATAALEEEDAVPALSQTGHGAAFMNYGSYYNIGIAPPLRPGPTGYAGMGASGRIR